MSLFGSMFDTPSVPSGGLFGTSGTNGSDGSRSNWWDALGLLGAALKDYSTHNQTNTLGSYAKTMQDSADQQKKAFIAQRLGAAFDQPNQVAVTPAVNDMSAQAPQLRAQAAATNAQPKAVPTVKDMLPLYTQAIGAGVDPSPYMSLQKMASQQQPRLLSPTEAQAMHLPNSANQAYAIGADGIPKPVGTADVKSEGAIQQQIALEKANPQLAVSRASQAETARHNRAVEAASGGAGGKGFSAPTTVEADAPGGQRSQFLAQQDKSTGQWYTGDQTRQPLSNVMLPGGIPGGGRAAAQISRIITAAKDTATGLQNISALPASSNTGWFGQMMGGPKGVGLAHATREVLANTLSSQDVQDANTTFVGIGKALGTLDAGGLQSSDTFMKQLDMLQLKPGDTGFTKMRKLAEMRQMADNALEAQLNGPLLSADQKKYANKIRSDLASAVPWKPNDVSKLERSSNPSATLLDYASGIGLRPNGPGPAPLPPPKAGTVSRGYQFTGGDPSDRRNWIPVK